MYKRQALIPLFESTEQLKDVLEEYRDTFDQIWNQIQAHKIGLKEFRTSDNELYDSLWSTLRLTATDFTIFFRQLAKISPQTKEEEIRSILLPAIYKSDDFNTDVEAGFMQWIKLWQQRVSEEDPKLRIKTMNTTNPEYVLRNYLALNAIDAAEKGDFTVMEDIMRVLRTPYDEQPDAAQYAVRRPAWATTRPGCTMLTCSS